MKRKWIVFSIISVILITSLWGYSLFNRQTTKQGTIDNNQDLQQPMDSERQFYDFEYDVVVIGGEPEGVAAAVSAARNGANTLLIEKRNELGGLFTYGMLNFLDIPQGVNGNFVSKGIFEEWHALVGGKGAFHISEAKAAFQKLVDEEERLTLLTNTEVLQPVFDGNQVIGVEIQNDEGQSTIKGKTFIDATQDADFAAMSGVPYFIGAKDIGSPGKTMSATLMIHLKNINWDRIKEAATSKKYGSVEVFNNVAWGFGELCKAYQPVEEHTRLRGLNIAKNDQDYYINALQIFEVDGLNEQSKQEALEKGKRETEHIVQFLRERFPGFEHAEIASFPPELYVRETRHILAEYQLSMKDVWTNRDQWDSIAIGGYPVDMQIQTPVDSWFVVSTPIQYAIPFRSLVPLQVDGLLVVGRSAGFSSIAAGSARVVPTGMATGEAAGAAAALAISEKMSFREMSKNEQAIETLRTILKKQGAFVEHFSLDYPYKGEWYDQAIQTLINYGLIIGGYTNDLHVDEVGTTYSFMNLIRGAFQRVNPSVDEGTFHRMESVNETIFESENVPLEKENAVEILSLIFFENPVSVNWHTLVEEGIIQSNVDEQIDEKNHELTMKELYGIVESVIYYIQGEN